MPDPAIPELPEQSNADVSDDDLLVMYDLGSGSAKHVTRGNMLKNVPREDGNHNFGIVEIDDLTATDATANELSIITSLNINGATITKVLVDDLSITVPDILTLVSDTQTVAMAGITVADFLSTSLLAALPDGLSVQAWISNTDEISFKFYNSTAATIAGAVYGAKATVIVAS